MSEIDFGIIAPRGGSVENAFEELCCQLASRTRPAGTKFERYRGDGGDGGVECKTINANGSATGWQTKYVFDIEGLLRQAQQSLETALWMPNNAKWLYAFVGEYPWASACNVETDDWLGFDTKVRGSNLEFIPVFNEVVCEWEYDGTLPSSIYFHVPARAFFKAGPLWWDSVDGFATPHGKTVFRDPSASEGGPATLLAEVDELLLRLEKVGCRLVWTLLGEKWILGDQARARPRVTYSQTAFLNKDGSIAVGDRVFFDDYNKDQGLAI